MSENRNETLISKRKSCALLQEQVANTVGISVRQYRNIEAGTCKPNVETAISIAELLKSDVIYLFGPQRQLRENDSQENSNTEGEKQEISHSVAAAKLSRIPADVMVEASEDLQDGSADTPEGEMVLDLMKKAGGMALAT